MDLAAEFSVRLPLWVIAELLGIPTCDRPQFRRWSDAILGLAETVGGGEQTARAALEYGNCGRLTLRGPAKSLLESIFSSFSS